LFLFEEWVLLLLEYVEALLNLLQSYTILLWWYKFYWIERLREPKQRNCTTYITSLHQEIIVSVHQILGLMGNYNNIHLVCNFHLLKLINKQLKGDKSNIHSFGRHVCVNTLCVIIFLHLLCFFNVIIWLLKKKGYIA
jgi:hypothetical protein